VTAPLFSVYTPVHNKHDFAAQAIRSVLAQDFADFEYRIIENSTDGGRTRQIIAPLLGDPRIRYAEVELTAEERAACYVPAMLLNRFYPAAEGTYIAYLSDDDLLDPQCLSRVAAFFEARPDAAACWFGMRFAEDIGSGPVFCGGIPSAYPAGLGTAVPVVDCRIDGGQVVHRKDCLDRIDWPWFPETPEPMHARHADGLFLQRLAGWFTFWPLGEDLMTHRRTPLSVWDHV
jgi:spore maturation protein CgeD